MSPARRSSRELEEGQLMAAVDLGSNSFHMVVARHEHGELRVIDRLRESVRLAAGLRSDGSLQSDSRDRALGCLARFGQRLSHIPLEQVRAVATNTVRRMRAPQAFLMTAETALGHPVEIVSGREEARLIYLGVSRGIADRGERRLVFDIGGGSTEFIIGEGALTLELESLQMGCVATTARLFSEGRISRKRWQQAQTWLEVELQRLLVPFRSLGWDRVIGSSGTIKAAGKIVRETGFSDRHITAEAIDKLVELALKADHVDHLQLPGLSSERRPVFIGGLAILSTVMKVFNIDQVEVCKTAMREGLLHDLLGRVEHRDPREASITALAQRYSVDRIQARRVETTALQLFEQISSDLGMDKEERDWLSWAARVHEVGLAISHNLHHAHGAYLLEHSDLPGFSRQEQLLLSRMLRAQRRAVPGWIEDGLPQRTRRIALPLMSLLRLAVLLHRSRSAEPLPQIGLRISEKTITLSFPKRWLDTHALTRADLEQEKSRSAKLGYRLVLEAD